MLITEKDIYKYVFFPSTLSIQRKVYIDNNIKKFSDQIQMLSAIKEDLYAPVPAELTEKINSKIRSKQENTEIILEKRDAEINGYDKLILAAASKDEIQELVTQTYFNQNKTFILKIVSNKNTSKLYLFSNGDKDFSNLQIKLYPSLKTYEIDVNIPLEIERISDVEKVGLVTNFNK